MELIKYGEEDIVKLYYKVGNYIIKIEILLTAKLYNVLKKYQNKNLKEFHNQTFIILTEWEQKHSNKLQTKYSIFYILDQDKESLKREIRGAAGVCFKCGIAGHFVNECRFKKKANRKSKRSAFSSLTQIVVHNQFINH